MNLNTNSDEYLTCQSSMDSYKETLKFKPQMEQFSIIDEKEQQMESSRSILNLDQSFSMQNSVSAMNAIYAMDDLSPNLAFKSAKNFMVGVTFLAMMVLCNSLITPIALLLDADNVFIKICWRGQGTFFLSLILSIIGYVTTKGATNPIKDIWNNLGHLAKPGILMCFWNFAYIYGGSMTVTSHAAILYSSCCVYMLLFALITGQNVPTLCKMALAFYVSGGYLMISDPSAAKVGAEGSTILGDVICFAGAAFGSLACVYFTKIPSHIPVITKNAGVFMFSALTQIVIVPFIVGFDKFYSLEHGVGGFTWMFAAKSFFVVIFVVALITGVVGNIGYIQAFRYFPAELVAGCMLFEPVFGQLGGILLGQDEIPGVSTLIGGTIITLGFFLSGYGEKQKSQQDAIFDESDPIEDNEFNL